MTSPKVWFITGAARGFGLVWTEAALRRGDKVAATARDTTSLNDLAATYGDAVLILPLDVTDRSAVFDAVGKAHSHFGRLDVVVSNAGYGYFGAIEEIEPEQARVNFDTNLFGTLWPMQAVLPILARAGQRSHHNGIEHRRRDRLPDGRDLYGNQICDRGHVGRSGCGGRGIRHQRHDPRARPLHHGFRLIGPLCAGHRGL
ncbi:NAD(P)-dependent dehydrogenase (short-subunit alcohol dehydrogenase family) [Rhizobium sp. OAE497]